MGGRFLYAVRHGETDWNAAQRWQGHTDVPLNERGRAQATAVARALRAIGVAGVVASDLSRAEQTARIIAAELGIDVSYLDPALRERAFGCFEGLTHEECERLHPEQWRAWLGERRTPDGAETHEALTTRAVAAVGRAVARLAAGGGPLLLVTHGGTLRALVAAATGALPAPVGNGEVWRLGWDGGLVSAERT